MNFSSEATISILEMALQREKETRDFYRECLVKASIEGTKAILRGLVDDEEKHYEYVSILLNEARTAKSPSSVPAGDTAEAKTIIEKLLTHTFAGAENLSETIGLREMLDIALANESESYTNYANGARDASEPEVKAIFDYLANEENRHYVLINNLIGYLSDPGKWLYEEENLIFRRG